jgi:type IV pilus assembly protein PilN
MIRINLLPVRQNRKLDAARKDLFLAVLGGLLVLGTVAAGWTLLSVQLSTARTEVAALQAEVDKLKADVAKVEEAEKFKAELAKKLAVIGELRARKNGPVHLLEDLANATPDRLRLTGFKQIDKDLSITGVAVSNEVISQFLRSLDASPWFDAVYLQNIEATPPDPDYGAELKRFELTARTSTPTVADLATASGAVTQPAVDATAPDAATPTPDAGAPPAPEAPATAPASPAPTDATAPAATPAATEAPKGAAQ